MDTPGRKVRRFVATHWPTLGAGGVSLALTVATIWNLETEMPSRFQLASAALLAVLCLVATHVLAFINGSRRELRRMRCTIAKVEQEAYTKGLTEAEKRVQDMEDRALRVGLSIGCNMPQLLKEADGVQILLNAHKKQQKGVPA